MNPHYYLVWVDYMIMGLTTLIPVVIGIKFQLSGSNQRTSGEYLLAGKNMSLFPVIMSIAVTILSGIMLLGYPAEVYRFGMQFALWVIPISIGTILTAVIFIPVYFNCGVATTYEFLEIRYGKSTRFTVSALFIIQTVLYMSVVLYAPVLALSAVTDLSIEASIVAFGLLCSFYCAIGGLKGVLWADVFQSGLMFLCIILVYAYSLREAGGVANVYKTALEGQRLNFFDFSMDFTQRYTVLNLIFKSMVGAMGFYGTSQVEVQRLLSLSTIRRAQYALCWSVVPVSLLILMCSFLGLVFFTIFKDCDPIADKEYTKITKYDQVVPYYIVTRLHSIPGLTGLCIAGIISGSLSTISSGLNSLATVTVLDFIKPLCKKGKLNDTQVVYISKALSLLFGFLCVGFAFAVSKVDSLVAIGTTLASITEGPTVAIFLIGILTRKGSQKCILFGFILGIAMTSWIGFGIAFGGHRSPSLPVETKGCRSSLNSSLIFGNITAACEGFEQCPSTVKPALPVRSDLFILSKVSFMWISPIGLLSTLFAIFLAILVTGEWNHDVIPSSSKCLSPVTKIWMKRFQLQEPSALSEEQASLTNMNEFPRTIDIARI